MTSGDNREEQVVAGHRVVRWVALGAGHYRCDCSYFNSAAADGGPRHWCWHLDYAFVDPEQWSEATRIEVEKMQKVIAFRRPDR